MSVAMNRLILIATVFAVYAQAYGQAAVSLRLVASLDGHTDQVSDVVFSSDGKLLASCSHDGTVMLWHVESRELNATLKVQEEPLYALDLSPDNTTLATAGLGGMVTLWNVTTRLRMGTYQPTTFTVTDLAWSSDGESIVLRNGRGLVIVPTNGGKPRVVEFEERDIRGATVNSMALARDGDRIAVGGRASTVAIWSRKQNAVVDTFSARPKDAKDFNNLSAIMTMAFSPTQHWLVVSSGFKIPSTVTAWDPWKKVLKTRFAGDYGTVWGIAFSPNGNLLAGAGTSLVIWDTTTGSVLDTWSETFDRRVRDTGFHAYNLAFSSNGRLIASGGADKTVKIFSVDEK